MAFLEWLCADNFTFLGSQVIDYGDRDAPPTVHPGHGLLTDPNYPLWRGMRGVADLPPQLSQFLHAAEPILITKANAMSHVHRRVHLDYIAVKRFDGAGQLVGERRFVGLFTSTAYATNPRTVPVLRGKVQQVIARCGFDPRSHAGKALVHVLEQFPRDELFQIDVDLLERTAIGLLSLMDRPRPKLFVRHDRFERHVSILVYVPRDIYRADLRKRIGDMLQGPIMPRSQCSPCGWMTTVWRVCISSSRPTPARYPIFRRKSWMRS
nr:NAD-glutamate dehydrogenase domain-containing protein [Hankyongella ginsenosidimutans]